MKVSKKESKENELQFEDLNDQWFFNFQNNAIEVDNILKLLTENIYSFQELVDRFKSIKDDENDPCLYYLLWNKGLFKELIQNNKLTQDDLRYLLNRIDNSNEVANLVWNTSLLKHIVDKDIVSFKELVDKFKNIKDSNFDLCLYILLTNQRLFEELIEDIRLNKEDIVYLLNKINRRYELEYLSENTSLLKYIVDKNILSFKELVDKFKNFNKLDSLLKNEELVEELTSNNKVNKEDTSYLLNMIDTDFELNYLCIRTSLLKHILNEFVLDEELVDRFNRMIENDEWRKRENIHTIFDMIEHRNKYNEEILKLSKLNRTIYTFDLAKGQRDELAEVLKNNKIARNRLTQIIDNHLESQYDFESLMDYLKKKEKKSILNI